MWQGWPWLGRGKALAARGRRAVRRREEAPLPLRRLKVERGEHLSPAVLAQPCWASTSTSGQKPAALARTGHLASGGHHRSRHRVELLLSSSSRQLRPLSRGLRAGGSSGNSGGPPLPKKAPAGCLPSRNTCREPSRAFAPSRTRLPTLYVVRATPRLTRREADSLSVTEDGGRVTWAFWRRGERRHWRGAWAGGVGGGGWGVAGAGERGWRAPRAGPRAGGGCIGASGRRWRERCC